MNARAAETARRRRVRREALARAEREWVWGAPLVDVGEPILSGGDAFEHQAVVALEIHRRMQTIRYEAIVLARYFASKCWVVRAEAEQMDEEFLALLRSVRGGGPVVTHSTAATVTATTIPRLESC